MMSRYRVNTEAPATACLAYAAAMRGLRLLPVLAMLLALGACASRGADSPPPTAGDPLEPLNRNVLAFNTAIDDAAIQPVAMAYRKVVPAYGRRRVRAFLDNLDEPRVFVNQLLQFRPLGAAETMLRFVFNSTVGVAGLYDVATDWGLGRHHGDLGQTLWVWGVGDGPYLMLPVAGPSNARDLVGLVGDGFMNPFNWLLPVDVSLTRAGVDGIDVREQNIEGLDELRSGSLDFYARLRSVWQQRRDAQLARSGASSEAVDVLEDPGAAP
jgi:phospholipid-binding lipoprotein MlaA